MVTVVGSRAESVETIASGEETEEDVRCVEEEEYVEEESVVYPTEPEQVSVGFT